MENKNITSKRFLHVWTPSQIDHDRTSIPSGFSNFPFFHRFYFLVNVALPNMLFAAMAGLQFFVDVDKVADRPFGNPKVWWSRSGSPMFTTSGWGFP